ncbi:MAG: hypothetical protein CVU47_11235 [Chloroflexi bacterium HGW-Chloroflexi-9]|nr:MAG: hypothetical protein CVU47_11235 [Chloroflexi bacterium HGW-Chloroflexi-9]
MNLTVTDIAQQRLSSLIGERAAETGQAIRVFIAEGGCGCSGPRFGMGLDEAREDDAVMEFGVLKFVVDPASAPVLSDASIDYIEDVMQQGFQITAPNAQSGGGGCACGGGAH